MKKENQSENRKVEVEKQSETEKFFAEKNRRRETWRRFWKEVLRFLGVLVRASGAGALIVLLTFCLFGGWQANNGLDKRVTVLEENLDSLSNKVENMEFYYGSEIFSMRGDIIQLNQCFEVDLNRCNEMQNNLSRYHGYNSSFVSDAFPGHK